MNKTLLRRMIKATAIRDMQGNWWKAFFLSLLESVAVIWIISYIPFRIPTEEEILATGGNAAKLLALLVPKDITAKNLMSVGVTALLYLFVMSPFSIGMNRYFLKAAKGENGTLGDVFSAFGNIRVVFSSVILTVITFAFTAISLAVFMIIPVGLMILSKYNGSVMPDDISYILLTVFFVLFVVWISRYKFISYIYAYEEKGVFATLYKYFKYMKKKNGECLILGASYFGWVFMMTQLPFLTFIYQCLSSTVYAKYLLRFRGELSFGEFENQTPPSPPPEV